MILALWGREELAADSRVADGGGWGGVTLAYNVRSPEEVDAVLARAEAAGARIGRPGGGDLLGRLLGRVRRPRRPSLGGRPQPALDARRGRLGAPAGRVSARPPYVELHAHSAFSFLDGASRPGGDGRGAAELGHGARPHRPRRPLGVPGLCARRPRRGSAPHHRGGDDAGRRRRPPHPSGRDRTGLRQPLPPPHARPRAHAAAATAAPAARTRPRASRPHAEGLVCLTGCAREGWCRAWWRRAPRRRRAGHAIS